MRGKTNNPNGRPKGKPNRLTGNLKITINEFLNNNWDNVQRDFDKATNTERLRFFEKLLPYVIPKLQSVEYRSEDEQLIDSLSDEQIERLYSIITHKQNENDERETC